ncbi:MAG: hypothetical protein UFF97_04470 [Collinsella sp.]|nr:hypothetical protein [Collinsella sp.]
MQKAFPIFAMELFCDGWLFLTHSDVTWDGSSHAVKRIRVNSDKSEGLLGHAREHFTDVPSNIDLCQYVGTTLVELEKHTELVVPRDDVSPRLQLLFEGDLTPITLVQLMCVGDWLSVRQTGEDKICVAYDERLAQQISGFGFFMRRFRAVLCSQSAMLSGSVVATVFEPRPATKPGICVFLEMDEAALAKPEPEAALDVEQEPESESETAPESASEPAPEPSAKAQEKLRIAREVKAARDKMEELDQARVALLNQLLVLRYKHEKLSDQRGWRTNVEMEEVGRQIDALSGQVDQIDEQLRDARLVYAETRAASLQALKELGQ